MPKARKSKTIDMAKKFGAELKDDLFDYIVELCSDQLEESGKFDETGVPDEAIDSCVKSAIAKLCDR